MFLCILFYLLSAILLGLSKGRGDKGQLGHGDVLRCEVPKLIDVLKDFSIVNAACGRNHTMCLTGKEPYSPVE